MWRTEWSGWQWAAVATFAVVGMRIVYSAIRLRLERQQVARLLAGRVNRPRDGNPVHVRDSARQIRQRFEQGEISLDDYRQWARALRAEHLDAQADLGD